MNFPNKASDSTSRAPMPRSTLRVALAPVAMAIVTLGSLSSERAVAQVTDARASASAAALEGIVITSARKRKELLQDVPISMEMLSGAELKDAGITRVQDIQTSVPGLVIAPTEAQAGVSIRGVGTGDVGLGTDQSVAIHIDGVYQAFGGSGLARMFDVDRIEVLRGPQGTLYGRNSTAGVVNVISRAPTRHFEGEVQVGVGSNDLQSLQGVLNVPVSEETAVRLAFITSDSKDWLPNADGMKGGASDVFTGFRGRFRTVIGSVKADLAVQNIVDRSTYAMALIAYPGSNAPASIYNTGVAVGKPRQQNEDTNVALTLSGEVGDVTLMSITGYGSHAGTFNLSFGNVTASLDGPYSQWSQELQAQFTTGAAEWTAGAFYMDSEGRDKRKLLIADPVFPFEQNTEGSYARSRSAAVFADVNYPLSSTLKANAGLRYTVDEKTGTIWGTTPFDIPGPPGATDSRSFSAWSGRVGLDYKLDKQTLIYGGAARGFKSGGVVPMGIDPDFPLDVYKPELLTSYEVGQKTTLAGGAATFNLSAFVYDYTDKVEMFSTDAVNPLTFKARNVQRAKLHGAEAYADLRVARHLRIDGNVALLEAKYDEFKFTDAVSGSVVNLSGNQLSRAPMATYTLGLVLDAVPTPVGNLHGRLEYFHRSKVYFDAYNLQEQSDVGIVNASLRLAPPGRSWSVSASVRNLADVRYIENAVAGSYAVPSLGRTWQLGASVKF